MTGPQGSLLPRRGVLVVCGSLNAKGADRFLDRARLHPVQVLTPDGIVPVPLFDPWGTLGVSSMAWHPDRPALLYISTGDDLVGLDLEGGKARPLPVPHLHDVHEMTVVDDTLWIANTGRDEALAIDLRTEGVRQRVALSALRSGLMGQDGNGASEGAGEVVDRFHCNQVFRGMDGRLYSLVHHVSGKQFVRQVAERVIKSQGNGGVVDLATGRGYELSLKAPHSVRVVEGHYWVFDSGAFALRIYDPAWREVQQIPSRGWGRGAALCAERGLLYAGISETRKRYLGVIPGSRQAPNLVEVISLATRTAVGEVLIPNVEQVNNVYLMPASELWMRWVAA